MADTSSIASRMEKLAKLKRMKMGVSGEADVDVAPEPSEPTIAMPSPMGSDSVETELNVAVALDEADSDPTLDIQDALGLGDEDASGAPALAGAEDDSEVDYDGGAADDIGNTEFAEYASDDDDELGLPEDLQDAAASADEEAATDDEPESFEAYFDSLGIPDEPLDGDADNADNADSESTNAAMSASDLGIDDDTMGALDELAALTGVAGKSGDDESIVPDFTMSDVDPDTLESEFEHEQSDSVSSTEDTQGRISVTFDDSRTTLLNHVSRQMNCSVEDVVVTALDWYLDALFGEDEEAKTG